MNNNNKNQQKYASIAMRRASAWRESSFVPTADASSNFSTRSDGEPTDNALRDQYKRLEFAFFQGVERDRDDVEENLRRERKFTVEYLRLSTNRIWASKEGDPVTVYSETVEVYKKGQKIWPRGRKLTELSVYGQIWDFFRFMWQHTTPYKTVACIMLMSLYRPVQVAILSYLAQEIENDPRGVSPALYFAPVFAHIIERFLYWWYEMWVPLNSQRVQMRCVLLSQRIRLPDSHPLAAKWPSGRFNGLLKDVDDVINGIWQSCLQMFDEIVTMVYLLILCFTNLAVSVDKALDGADYGVYVALFLGIGIGVMILPLFWFYLFHDKIQECEDMIREGQSLYLSTASDAVAIGYQLTQKPDTIVAKNVDFEKGVINKSHNDKQQHQQQLQKQQLSLDYCAEEGTSRKAFRIYGLTTFRAFFHRLAWKMNFGLLSHILGSIIAYSLLTADDFGDKFDLRSTLIVLLALKDISVMTDKLLGYLVKMSRGTNVLIDIAELLNADINATSIHSGIEKSHEIENNNKIKDDSEVFKDCEKGTRKSSIREESIVKENDISSSDNQDAKGEKKN